MNAEQAILMMLGSALTLTTSYIMVKVNRMEKKADKRHEEGIQRESLLCTHRSDMGDLILETAKAVQTGRSNGELSGAIEQFEITHRKYEDFVRVQAGTRLAENR